MGCHNSTLEVTVCIYPVRVRVSQILAWYSSSLPYHYTSNCFTVLKACIASGQRIIISGGTCAVPALLQGHSSCTFAQNRPVLLLSKVLAVTSLYLHIKIHANQRYIASYGGMYTIIVSYVILSLRSLAFCQFSSFYSYSYSHSNRWLL